MEQFANDAPELRDEAFQETAAQLGMSKAIIEKDFWVCWSLKQLFALPSFGEQMIFKGGTSLSKAYDVIHRFSEDVDLSLDREQLGFVGDRDPEGPDLSGKKQKRLLQELEEAAKEAVGGQLLAEIQTAFGSSLEQSFTLSVDPSDPQTILFAYPALAESDAGYVKPSTLRSWSQDYLIGASLGAEIKINDKATLTLNVARALSRPSENPPNAVPAFEGKGTVGFVGLKVEF